MNLQKTLNEIIHRAIGRCIQEDIFGAEAPEVVFSRPKRPEHGDFATNVALLLAKPARKGPRDLAEAIVTRIEDPRGMIARAEVAGPGFINIKLSDRVWFEVLERILATGESWGSGDPRPGPATLIEFVSANPTGPLHVGHGRGAVVGDALARLLRFAGYPVTTEYYLNDAGSQVQKLARSIHARIHEILRESDPGRPEVPFPEDGYPGDYVRDIAHRYIEERGELQAGPLDEAALRDLAAFGVQQMRAAIADTLARMNIIFDVWASERSLHEQGALESALGELRRAGHLYEEGGAVWFRSSAFTDEKDRVVVRDSGEPTYFAADIAYHRDKLARGFDHLINIWGADHHGYVPRMKGAIQALGRTPESLEVLLVQFVALLKGGQKLQQGKRLGQFVTVDVVLDQVGPDVARYFFLERKFDAQVDFDLEVAISEDPRVNPAKYVQYGHARACSILAKAADDLGVSVPPFDLELARRLAHPDELAILRQLAELPVLVQEAAAAREPHRIVSYLHEVSRAFQSYYTRLRREDDPVLPPASERGEGWEARWDKEKMMARLMWVDAIRIVCKNALTLLGLQAPSHMARIEEAETTGGDHA